MKIAITGKRLNLTWALLDRDIYEGDVVLFAIYLHVGKWERGHIFRLRGGLDMASMRYDTFFNGKRTGWMMQSPVHRVY